MATVDFNVSSSLEAKSSMFDTSINSRTSVVNDTMIGGVLDQQGNQLSTDIQSKHQNNTVWDDSFHGKFYSRGSETAQILEAYRRVRVGVDTNNDVNSNISELILVEGETVRS
jgi:hypothetical protein